MNIFYRTVCAVALALITAAPLPAGAAGSLDQLLTPGADAPEVPVPPVPAPAAVRTDECAEIPSVGCYYSGAPAGESVPLLIYYRGWISDTNYPGSGLYGGRITGKANILRSSRAALSFYKLKQLAAEKRIAVLVTGSSDIAVTRSDLDSLQASLGVVFRSVSAAAHSGGYVGLGRSIDSFSRLEKVILLDPFYSDFSAKIAAQIGRGAVCTGFYTPHNAARYKRYFSGIGCNAEPRTSAADHEFHVPASLQKSF